MNCLMRKQNYTKPINATCSQEFADLIDHSFPPLTIVPGMDHAEIMFAAGQRTVVEMVQAHIRAMAQDNQINRTID